MTTNVLPLFWHLASSSKDTRLQASADLVSSVETFQKSFVPGPTAGSSSSSDSEQAESDEDDDEDDIEDAESGVEVDESDEEDEEMKRELKRAAKLDKEMAKNNSEDVVYCVKRLVRGLGSSRESSRLGFAVALTEVRFLFPWLRV